MKQPSRREFVLGVVRGTVYAAPVVASLAAPARASAQPGESHKMSGNAMDDMDNKGKGKTSNQNKSALPSAPWFRPPPGKGGG